MKNESKLCLRAFRLSIASSPTRGHTPLPECRLEASLKAGLSSHYCLMRRAVDTGKLKRPLKSLLQPHAHLQCPGYHDDVTGVRCDSSRD